MHQDDLIFTPPAKHRLDWRACLLVAPAVVVLAVFVVYPAVFTLTASLRQIDIFSGTSRFAWLTVFHDQATSPRLWRAVLVTLYFGAVYIPASLLIGYAIARLIDLAGAQWGPRWRIAFFLPAVIPPAAAAIMWKTVYDGNAGLLNAALGTLGIPGAEWLHEPYLVIPCIAAACIWQSAGPIAAILSAAIWAMPPEADAMARTDGAGRWARFVHIHLPMLKGPLAVCFLLLIINSLRVFTLILILTGDGGPANWSTNLPFLVYRQAMKEFDFSGASAVSTAIGFFVAIAVLLVHRHTLRGREHP